MNKVSTLIAMGCILAVCLGLLLKAIFWSDFGIDMTIITIFSAVCICCILAILWVANDKEDDPI